MLFDVGQLQEQLPYARSASISLVLVESMCWWAAPSRCGLDGIGSLRHLPLQHGQLGAYALVGFYRGRLRLHQLSLRHQERLQLLLLLGGSEAQLVEQLGCCLCTQYRHVATGGCRCGSRYSILPARPLPLRA